LLTVVEVVRDDIGGCLQRRHFLILGDHSGLLTPRAGLRLSDGDDDLVSVLLALAFDIGVAVLVAEYRTLVTHCQEFPACNT